MAMPLEDFFMTFKDKIDQYMLAKGGKEAGFSLLQRRSKVPTSSLRRVVQGEQKPSFSNGLKIVSALTQDSVERQNLLKELFPLEMRSILETFTEKSASSDVPADELDRLYDHLQSPTGCAIVHICASAAGTTKRNIERVYGSAGLKALAELEDDGLVVELNEKISLRGKNFAIRNAEVAKMAALNLATFFDIQNLGSSRATLGIVSESLNTKGIELTKKAQLEFLKKVGEIRDNPDCAGDEVVYTVMMGNVLPGAKKEL
jgi:hypothetical protein